MLSLFFCFGLFSNKSCAVSAEVSGGRFLTPAETIEFYGSDLSCTYYNGSEFVTVTLHPTSNYTYHFANSSTRYEATDYITSSLPWIMYYSTVDVSDYVSNPNYLNIDITPNLTVSGCSDFYAAVATRCSTQGSSSQSSQPSVSTAAYDASFFDILAAGQRLHFSNSLLTTLDNSRYLCPCMTRDGISSCWSCLYVPVEWHTTTLSTVSTLRAGFYGATRNGGGDSARFEVYLSCPYVNPIEADVEQGVITTAPPSSGGDINVTVNVDLSPLETALQNVGSDVQGIANDVSGIGSLLVVDSPETIARLDLEPIDTLPTLDYHKVIDDVDAVLDDIPSAVAGTASIWGIIGSLFTSDSVWMWLVPFCVFMCLASFVLWRR